jgi:hypothetical protein
MCRGRGVFSLFATSMLVRVVQAMECRYLTGLAEKTIARSVVFTNCIAFWE